MYGRECLQQRRPERALSRTHMHTTYISRTHIAPERELLNALSRSHIHTTYMYIHAGGLCIYSTSGGECINTLQHTCNKGVLYELSLFYRESSVMDAYAERHHGS